MDRFSRYRKGLQRTARVLAKRPISATKLAKRLGISRPTAYARISDLRALGCVIDESIGNSTKKGGEPPTLFRLKRIAASLVDEKSKVSG